MSGTEPRDGLLSRLQSLLRKKSNDSVRGQMVGQPLRHEVVVAGGQGLPALVELHAREERVIDPTLVRPISKRTLQGRNPSSRAGTAVLDRVPHQSGRTLVSCVEG